MGVLKDNLLKYIIYLSTIVTVGILIYIIGFIFYNGISHINLTFLTSNFDSQTQFIKVESMEGNMRNDIGYIQSLGIVLEQNEEGSTYVASIDSNSTVKNGFNRANKAFSIKRGDEIQGIGDTRIESMSLEEITSLLEGHSNYELRVSRPGDGVYPMIITTLYIVLVSLAIAAPIGILSAIYLTEYAKPGKLLRLIRFATESLAGIPSIIYGLFGMIFFVITLNMGYSIIAGALTLSIILLPVIIRQTEESLKAIPNVYREGSLGLGATQLQTIRKVILPNAIPGILVAVILSIGRIIGESAALLLTAGTVARIPDSLSSGGASLTVKAYHVAKEEGNIAMACAIGTVIILLIFTLNMLAKIISKKLNRAAAK
ncbi:phosphate transport system permease protein [Natranaerovirga hydrolytica]|uniref:Phosphate transport system permease protein PstA n=1 Tax=Natranaerovirga hydrolytica TaxID=680378 RepID=A0A4R1N7Y1_9FIRM|nr:phosphate transport system permease protein [Natranaerovirga hydrolytica]